jgi:predicted transcriptional regulator
MVSVVVVVEVLKEVKEEQTMMKRKMTQAMKKSQMMPVTQKKVKDQYRMVPAQQSHSKVLPILTRMDARLHVLRFLLITHSML